MIEFNLITFGLKKTEENKVNKPYILAANKYDINIFIKYLYDNHYNMIKNSYLVYISRTWYFLIAKEIIDTKYKILILINYAVLLKLFYLKEVYTLIFVLYPIFLLIHQFYNLFSLFQIPGI